MPLHLKIDLKEKQQGYPATGKAGNNLTYT